VQGKCLNEQPYPLGTTIFWGIIVPASIFILLVFGHELWRRICPLSFLSQIPRALGWQRQFQRKHPKTGKVRYELAKVNADSWLGRNEILSYLETLLQEQNPMVQAAALYIIAQLDTERSQTISGNQPHQSNHPLIKETAEKLMSLSKAKPSLSEFPTLEKLVYLFNSDFFHKMQSETLIALAQRAEVRTYDTGGTITEAGDTCRELLLLIEGDANIHYQTGSEIRLERLYPGQTLDELEVLAHSNSENTIIAESEKTRILAIPVDAFDDLLHQDPDFARRVLELESLQLQRFVRSVQPL
jgi:hypothetical protein